MLSPTAQRNISTGFWMAAGATLFTVLLVLLLAWLFPDLGAGGENDQPLTLQAIGATATGGLPVC